MADIKSHSTLPTNLVSYWDLQEPSGTRYDLVGANNLTDNNTVLGATGKIGTGADFERGNSEYFSRADNAAIRIDDGWSVSFWVKWESLADYEYILNQRSGENGFGIISYASGRVDVEAGSGSYSGAQISGFTAVVDTWYHFVVCFNGTSSKVYINNTEYSISIPNITNTNGGFRIGNGQTSNFYFDGVLDEFGVWSKTLTTTEVSNLYNAGAGLPYYAPSDISNDATLSTNLVSYWELEEASGTRVDSHGSNDLTDNNTVGQATGIIGEGADFEKSNSEYLSLAAGSTSGLVTSNGARSGSVWLKLEAAIPDAGEYVIMSYGNYDLANQEWSWYIYEDGASLYYLVIDKYGAGAGGVFLTTLQVGSWVHYAYTYDGTTVIHYVNGVRLGSGAAGTVNTVNTDVFLIGARTGNGGVPSGGHMDGVMDELGFWSKKLSEAEVRALYGYGTPPPYDASAPTFTPTPMMHMMGMAGGIV